MDECKHLLPPESCALCTGSSARYERELRDEVGHLMKGDDLDRSFAFEVLRTHQAANDFSALPAERDARLTALDDMSIQQEHRRTHSTGMWNKTKEVLGGDDSQIEFESLEIED